MQSPTQTTYDVVIIGGAMLGSSVAWFLASNPDFDGSVLVVECDPTYAFASTSHTNSCIRQQFSAEINVKISQFGADYIKKFRRYMGDDPRVPDIAFHRFGYLYLADNQRFAATLHDNQQLQNACGAGTRHLTRDQIAADFPFLWLDDIVAGNHNPIDEGYFDGNTIFDWWKRAAQERGVVYVQNTVTDLHLNDAKTQVTAVVLDSGEVINCGTVINASGPRAALTARMAGIEIPVEPRKRYTYIFEAAKPLEQELPLTIDPAGVHMRSEGAYYLAGCPPDDDPAVGYTDFVQDHSLWEEKVWPILARRIPQFEAIKLRNSWVGHYAYNTFDQNAIVGPHPDVRNFLFVNGFSGHGLQQSPAMGRGTAEWITYGEYRSLDLSALHFERIQSGAKFVEKAVI
ncbi:NAD(P)/FAD-dependent oxidoreductase [Loktanella sp. S4079]|uniref:NAD(P)/FAD-dependent oxidoreductase n=1 Tax=Loktanella sp. S4079 TaxID=579483 RepID=UPI0005FA38CE|nr:FAD-binding oxidoreductase [Loktanella sp. S4079]KJZ20908.1 FAD-dependent oxidoreductase [Loktanella sp. S4079]